MHLERRNFLRGRFKPSTNPVVRPPYAIVEHDFLSVCVPCADCINSCEEKIIKTGEAGYPEVSFDLGECTFCGHCVSACTTGALDRGNARPWKVIAEVGANCLAFNGVFCRTCGDNCDEDAITFKLMINGRSQPIVDEDDCTGCGACAYTCPNQSLTMHEGQQATATL